MLFSTPYSTPLEIISYLCTRFRRQTAAKLQAQMAESVDALVSNTSGATRAGSTPALGTSILR